jgi:hypothetical protein
MKQQPSLFTHVFLVTTVRSSNKEYRTFVTKFAIKVVVIPEVSDISSLVHHVCLNSLHHLSNFMHYSPAKTERVLSTMPPSYWPCADMQDTPTTNTCK